MLLFAHIGLTLGTALGAKKIYTSVQKDGDTAEIPAAKAGSGRFAFDYLAGGLFDLRLWVLGGLLPDIIDKPVGFLFFNNGRIFSHSLVFFLLLLGAGCLPE